MHVPTRIRTSGLFLNKCLSVSGRWRWGCWIKQVRRLVPDSQREIIRVLLGLPGVHLPPVRSLGERPSGSRVPTDWAGSRHSSYADQGENDVDSSAASGAPYHETGLCRSCTTILATARCFISGIMALRIMALRHLWHLIMIILREAYW